MSSQVINNSSAPRAAALERAALGELYYFHTEDSFVTRLLQARYKSIRKEKQGDALSYLDEIWG